MASHVAVARFWQIVRYVCIGALASFGRQGPSCLSLLSSVLSPGPQGLFGGCRAFRGLSAGDLLQGPQGRLQGHVHSVADGFRVVWHRLTSALWGGKVGVYIYSKVHRCHWQPWGPCSSLLGSRGPCCSCLRPLAPQFAISGARLKGPHSFQNPHHCPPGCPQGGARALCDGV